MSEYDGFEGPQTNTLATFALVIGILALVSNGCCCIPYLNTISWIVPIVVEIAGVIVGILAINSAKQRGGEGMTLAKVGLGLSLGGVGVSLAFIILSVVFGVGLVALSAMSGGY
jgi:hypothetical protein